MIAFLSKLGFQWRATKGYPDYYPDKDGGSLSRSIEGKVFNMKRLGDWQQHLLLYPNVPNVAIYTYEAPHSSTFLRSWKSAWIVINALLLRTLGRTLLGQKPVTLGKSLVSQLMLLNKSRGIRIFRESLPARLLIENEKVVSAVVNHKGRETRVLAKRGILLCAGGFAKNQQMREKYGKTPTSVKWTLVPPNATGDAVRAGEKVGAALALMDYSWLGPTLVNSVTNQQSFMIFERSLPHGIIVDSHGKRFMNAAQSYADCGHAQYERNVTVPAIPAWLIVDSRHRNRYLMAGIPPRRTPKWVLESGWLKKADSLKELAKAIGVDGDGLQSTVERFNKMAARGIDDDFGRGRTTYDQFFGDQTCKPDPNVGSLEKPPFFAIEVWPGDLGTKGGLLTDEHARAVKENGKPISGLYAAGNTSASVMGRTYAGPGSTLGPVCPFAFIAMDHLAQEKQDV